MALTIVSNPGVNHALYGNETQFKVSTDRTIGAGATAVNITGSATASGDTRFTTESAHGFIEGDIVTLQEFTTYDGTVEISNVSDSTHFDTEQAYSGSTETGTAAVNNLNFKVKCEIQNTAGTIVYATKYIYPVSDYFYLDLDNILKSLVVTNHQDYDTAALIAGTGNVIYEVLFTEMFDDEDGEQKEADNITSSDTVCYGMSVDYDANLYLCGDTNPNKLSTISPVINLNDDGDYQLHFNTNLVCRVLVSYSIEGAPEELNDQFYPSTVLGLTPTHNKVIFPMNGAHLDVTNGYFSNPNTLLFTVTVLDSGTANSVFSNSGGTAIFTSVAHGLVIGDRIYISGTDVSNGFQTVTSKTTDTYTTDKIYDGDETETGSFYNILSETITVYKKDLNCNQITLKFLQQVGGFDNFTFLNETQKTTVSRENYKSGGVDLQRNKMARRTRHLVSDWLSDDWLDLAEQLITSPEVYLLEDDTWKRVSLVTSQMKYRDNDLINLEIDVMGQELNIIK